MTISSATSHPNIACGPPNAVMRSGIVMNGPTPIMLVMLSAVACSRPKRRVSDGDEVMTRQCSTGVSRRFRLTRFASAAVLRAKDPALKKQYDEYPKKRLEEIHKTYK